MKTVLHWTVSALCILITLYMCYESWIRITTEPFTLRLFAWIFATLGWVSITRGAIRKKYK